VPGSDHEMALVKLLLVTGREGRKVASVGRSRFESKALGFSHGLWHISAPTTNIGLKEALQTDRKTVYRSGFAQIFP
jgi:hypothetical protein